MKRYSVHVDGFDPYVCEAATASKARYSAYVAYCEAGYGRHWLRTERFRQFLARISVTLHLGSVEHTLFVADKGGEGDELRE